jgi:hypothetical protein
MAYDAHRGRVVLFGGRLSAVAGSTETWEWDGTAWEQSPTEVTPPGTASSTARTAAMTFDHLRGRVVLFDETSSTWEYDGVRWALRQTATSPPTRRQHAIAYDRARDETVLFGGRFIFTGGSSAIADTWVYQTEEPASLVPFGVGCAGSGGTPSLGTGPYEVPWIGARVAWQVADVPAGSPVLLAFGLSRTQWAGLGLPFWLAVLNAPGCSVLASWDITVPMQTAGTTASLTARMPEEPALLGTVLYNQAIVLDPPANGLGITVSNATAGTFGYR